MEYVITFKNTNFAIRAERYLLEQKLQVGVMPLPSQIRAGCGICLRISPEEIKRALQILLSKEIAEFDLYSRVEQERGYAYSAMNDWSKILG